MGFSLRCHTGILHPWQAGSSTRISPRSLRLITPILQATLTLVIGGCHPRPTLRLVMLVLSPRYSLRPCTSVPHTCLHLLRLVTLVLFRRSLLTQALSRRFRPLPFPLVLRSTRRLSQTTFQLQVLGGTRHLAEAALNMDMLRRAHRSRRLRRPRLPQCSSVPPCLRRHRPWVFLALSHHAPSRNFGLDPFLLAPFATLSVL